MHPDSEPYIGRVYFATDGQHFQVWNGTKWLVMTPPDAAAAVFKPTIEQIEEARKELIALRKELG